MLFLVCRGRGEYEKPFTKNRMQKAFEMVLLELVDVLQVLELLHDLLVVSSVKKQLHLQLFLFLQIGVEFLLAPSYVATQQA